MSYSDLSVLDYIIKLQLYGFDLVHKYVCEGSLVALRVIHGRTSLAQALQHRESEHFYKNPKFKKLVAPISIYC